MDWSPYDYFIISVSSHGHANKFQISHSQPMTIDYFQEQFEGVYCPGLLEKPKIFLVKTCENGFRQNIIIYHSK
jgi:hypothetical protein